MKSPGVRCYDCGFLALRCAREGQWRAHSGYVEAEQWHRDSPDGKFTIVPGETNATHPGEMVCFRGAADLSGEMATAIAEHGDQAARAVIVKHRQCQVAPVPARRQSIAAMGGVGSVPVDRT